MVQKPKRRWAALLFALVGLLAGATHVLTTAPESVQLWREVLPLACLVGAGLGALLRPRDWFRGAAAAAIALLVFALAYALAETVIQVRRGEVSGLDAMLESLLHWSLVVISKIGLAGLVAIAAGALAGFFLSRSKNQLSA
ncbi:MAG: hypothetical protein AAFY02_19905 [Pseudomonadota bacterium]